MNKRIITLSFLFAALAICMQSCIEDKCTEQRTYTYYEPVYLLSEDIRIDIQAESPRELRSPGKIYFHNQYVFINEVREGIHVINNMNPSNPINEAFVPIPGNLDIAVKGNILYADNYMDLLAINITNPTAPTLEKRVEDVFSWYAYNEEFGYNVHYERTDRTEELDCNHEWYGHFGVQHDGGVLLESTFDSDVFMPTSTNNSGAAQQSVAGSMARFGIAGEYLYALDEGNMDVYSIATANCPEMKNEVYVGWSIETLFPYGDHLFIGASDGMYIFNNTDPENPYEESKFEHARACDPVYVSGERAFVTLRNGNIECDGFENQLDILDIRDLSNPVLIRSYNMDNPHGLSVTPNQKLFLCEGSYGMKVLDATDSENVTQLGAMNGFDAYDVIALGENHIMVIGKDGFYQFNTQDPNNIQELSLIPVVQ